MLTEVFSKTMIELTLTMAEKAIAAAHAKAAELSVPMGVTVVDEAGRVVMAARADGAGFYTMDTSCAKAATSASYKRSTQALVEGRETNPVFWDALPSVIPGQVLPSTGAAPIIKEGRVIGAVGVGGGTPEQDHACALAGADAAIT